MTKAYEIDDIRQAVSASLTSSLMVGVAVNTTGYNRARFIFSLCNSGDGGIGTLAATGTIMKCATSGGTYSSAGATSVGAITSGVMSSANTIVEIDVPTEASYPWLKMSSFSLAGTAIYHSVICQLYNGIHKADASRGVNQTVTI